jgi:hypothetical protein
MYVVWNEEHKGFAERHGEGPFEVLSETPNFYRVKTKTGLINGWYKSRFDVVPEIVELEELL